MSQQQQEEVHIPTNHDDYYALLNISPQATRKQISDAYKRVALQCHPDRIRDPSRSSEMIHFFSKCTQAYEALSNPVTRALYDLVIGITEDSPEERRRINNMKKEDAKHACAAMEQTMHQVIEEERQRNGLVILDARYGRLEIDPMRPLTPPKSRPGQYIDVTIPVQAMVEDSLAVITGGGSKSWQEGFYDPSEDCEPSKNLLWIQYLFLGQLHQVTCGDDEEVRIPLPGHLITAQEAEMERELEAMEAREAELKKQRRRWLLTSLLLGVGGYLLYRNRGSPAVAPWISRLNSLVVGGGAQSQQSQSQPQHQQQQQQ